MATNPFIFQPVRGTEENISRMGNRDGFIYFAYDTGNIYLDKNGYRYHMGGTNGSSGATGFTWANATEAQVIKVLEDNDDDQTYYLDMSALEDTSIPKPDTLILNSDGRFFRVISIDGDNGVLLVSLIAVSGSGEGGGSGSATNILDLDLTWEGIDLLGSTYIYEKDNDITFIPSSTADEICSLVVKVLDESNKEILRRDFRVRNNQQCKINTRDFPVNDNLTITATVTSDHSMYNKQRGLTKTFKPIKVFRMYLEKPADVNMIGIQTNTARLSYNPFFTGLWTQQNPVKIYYSVDNGEGIFYSNLLEGNDKNKQYIEIPHQSHGTHIIKLWLSVNINNQEYTSENISYEVPFVDAGNEDPIIWIQEDLGTIIQYEPAVVHYMVYSSVAAVTGGNIEVQFLQDGVLFDTAEIVYSSNKWQNLDLTAKYVPGENHFSIVCGGTRKDIDFFITSDGARLLDLVHSAGLEVNFDSIGRSNKQIKANRINFVSSATPRFTSTPYKAILNDFNWYNNGWLDNNDGNGSYLAISNGASVVIPMSNISINTNDQPWSFEIRFRIRNAKKFATLVTEIPIYIWTDSNGIECKSGDELPLDEIEANGGTPIRDADGNLVMNEANTTRKVVRSGKYVAFKYLNDTNQGFAIGTQEAYFNVGGRVVNVKYRENEIINISFIINKSSNQLSIYLNGILSGVGDLSGISGFSMNNASFIINSEYCDFDLFKFRAYPLALTMPEVIHNYISDMKNTDLYDENQLADINDATKLSYQKLIEYNETHVDSPTMPYVVIDMSGETSTGNTNLPYAKTAKGIDGTRIEFTNPTADYLLETEQITPWQYYTHCPSYVADNVNINVQGTSSQIYPRRNFKTKFKKAKNWNFTQGPLAGKSIANEYYFNIDGSYAEETAQRADETDEDYKIRKKTFGNYKKLVKKWHLDSEVHSTNKFTWKVDYMESSGSYNTGFANLMGSGIYSKHPLEDLNIEGLDASTYRTSVYGFPMLAFHKTAEDTYTYIGRYNCNLDKGSNEYYGFEEEIEQPYITLEKEVDNGDGTTTIENYHPLIADVAECWELRDNQGLWCSFRYPTSARELGFETPISNDDPGIEVVKHFEARYHAKADQFEYGQNIILGKENNDDFSDEVGTDKATINSYLLNKLQNLRVLFNWLDSTDPQSVSNKPLTEVIGQESITYKVSGVIDEQEALAQGITYTDQTINGSLVRMGTFTKDSAEYRRQKFYAEFSDHLDKHYCAVYFVMTELLLCYDSRGKNMMLASFGPIKTGGDYIWYPIFYDIDTQLGLNNVGAQLWGYDEDCTENNTFSTAQSVLWMNFNDLFKEQILTTYRQLRGGGEDAILSYKNIEGAYTCDPTVFKTSYAMRGRRPILAMGLDEYYKYVLPVTESWINQEGEETTANYLYACQGDRKLSRELLINNRLLYMDSKWLAGSFTIGTGGMAGIMLRSTGNKNDVTSDTYIDLINPEDHQPGDEVTVSVKDSATNQYISKTFTYMPYKQGIAKYYDADPQYKVIPYLNFYITTFVDENTFQNREAYNEDKYPNGIPTVVLPSVLEGYQYGNVDQQLNYFAGSSYISSVGDLSTKYLNQLYIPNTPRLLDITLGSDAPGYFYNGKLDPFDLCTGIDDQTGLPKQNSNKPLLNKIILSNIRTIDFLLDVRSPDKLMEFRALGTYLKYPLFAEGAPLKTVHLPNTTEKIIFIQNKNLTRILKSEPIVADMVNDELIYRDPASYEGLYIAGVTDFNYIPADESTNTPSNGGHGSPVQEIDIEGDAMGYDSYTILNNVVLQKSGSGIGNRLSIKMTDVNWTPYTQVEYGETKNNNINYYLLTDHSTYELYEGAEEDWDTDTLNGKVFVFDDEAPKETISNLDLLDLFIADYTNEALGENDVNQFTNNVESEISNKTYPTLSGQLFVANGDAPVGISETALSSKYAAAWPNLIIRAEKIETSYLTKYVEIDPNSGKEIVLDNKAFSDDNTIQVPPAARLKIPTRTHYDFQGFSPIKPTSNQSIVPELYVVRNENNTGWELTQAGEAAIIDSEKKVLVLYAIFTPHLYQMSYYYQDGTLIEVVNCPYSPENGSVKTPTIPPSMDESNLPLNKTYKLLGYSEIQGETTNLVNFNTRKANRNMTFYAVFDELSVDKIDYSHYFTQVGVVNYEDAEDSSYNITGVELTLIPESTEVIVGKIVVPAKWNNLPVCGITNFCKQTHITHILFEEDHPLRKINSNCCLQMTTLQYFDFISLKHLRLIDDKAFYGIRNLILVDAVGPANKDCVLYSIGNQAFAMAFNMENRNSSLNILHIPSSVKTLKNNAFCPQPNPSNSSYNHSISIQIGDNTYPSQLIMPLVASNYALSNYQCLGANGGAQWGDIDFYSAVYDGNEMIKDEQGNNKAKLAEFLGLLRDNKRAMPSSFTIYHNNNAYQVIETIDGRTNYNE